MNKIIVPVFALTLFSCGGSTNQTEKKMMLKMKQLLAIVTQNTWTYISQKQTL